MLLDVLDSNIFLHFPTAMTGKFTFPNDLPQFIDIHITGMEYSNRQLRDEAAGESYVKGKIAKPSHCLQEGIQKNTRFQI